jgi:peptidoglycan hydrolase-like protein with peptidoglycan-binding domain
MIYLKMIRIKFNKNVFRKRGIIKMLKKLIVVPLVTIALSIGTVAVTPPAVEAKACSFPIRVSQMGSYPGYVMRAGNTSFDMNVFYLQYSIHYMYRYTDEKVYWIDADGYFGPATRAAVIRYQQVHGLQADGEVGPLTWNSILSHPKEPGY